MTKAANALSWRLPLLFAVLATGCAREEVARGLEEPQVNEVLVALDDEGVAGEAHRDEGADNLWRIDVGRGEAARARRVLADRELPRTRPSGFGQVFGKASIVPTATEERALYLHALSGELARTVEAVEGVAGARVHLALSTRDPLQVDDAPRPRAALLVKARPGARAAIEELAPGLRSIVAGAVPGLDAAAVSVVVTESGPPRPPPARTGGRHRLELLMGALGAALLAMVLAASAMAPRARLLLARVRRRRRLATAPVARAEPHP